MFCLHACIWTIWLPGALRFQKGRWNCLKLDLQMVVSYSVGLGIFCKNNKFFLTISLISFCEILIVTDGKENRQSTKRNFMIHCSRDWDYFNLSAGQWNKICFTYEQRGLRILYWLRTNHILPSKEKSRKIKVTRRERQWVGILRTERWWYSANWRCTDLCLPHTLYSMYCRFKAYC